jgi:hypothetical protein
MSPRTDSRWPPPGAADPIVFAPRPRKAVAAMGAGSDEEQRYVLHVPMEAPDLPGALDLAAALATSLAFPPQVHIGELAVSEEGNQRLRHRVFCDRLMPDRRRCLRRAGHDGACAPDAR